MRFKNLHEQLKGFSPEAQCACYITLSFNSIVSHFCLKIDLKITSTLPLHVFLENICRDPGSNWKVKIPKTSVIIYFRHHVSIPHRQTVM